MPVNGISVDGTKAHCGHCNDGEQSLDIDYAISMAPGLDQVQVYVARDPVAIEERMASDDTSKSLSTSWGYNRNFDGRRSDLSGDGCARTILVHGEWRRQDVRNQRSLARRRRQHHCGRRHRSRDQWRGRVRGSPNRAGNTVLRDPRSTGTSRSNRISFLISTRKQRLDEAAQRFGRFGQRGFRHDGLRTKVSAWAASGGTSFSSPIWAGFCGARQRAGGAGGQIHHRIRQSDPLSGLCTNPDMTHDIVRPCERQVSGRQGL